MSNDVITIVPELTIKGRMDVAEYRGGGVEPIFKNYMKFNGEGLITPWTLDGDHKIEVTFYETTYNNLAAVFGNTYNQHRAHLTTYQNKYYTANGTSETSFGAWSAGEHTFVINNGNKQNEFDGVEVTPYNPTTDNNIKYTIGCRGNTGTSNPYKGWIKSYKIYSLSTGELLHDVRPCRLYNTDCMFDTVSKTILTNPTIVAVDSI